VATVIQDSALISNSADLMMTTPSADGWLIEASADGTEWGNPEAVISAIQSQLQDGDLESIDRMGNREASIFLQISAPGSSVPGRAIALGQKALELAHRWPAGEVRELQWTSPLAGSEVTVTEMTSAVLSRSFDNDWDLDEVLRGMRRFKLTIHARPFVRGMTATTIDAPPLPGGTPPTDQVIDSGSSTTNWTSAGWPGTTNTVGTSTSDPFLGGTVFGASVRVGSTPISPWNTLTRTATIAVDSTRPYLLIKGKVRYRHDVTGNYGYAGDISITAASTSSFAPLTLINMQHNSTTGAFTALVQQNSSIDSLTVKLQTPSVFRVARYSMWTAVDSITRTAGAISGVFTGKVQSRQVQIYGSQRTELSLSVLGLDQTASPVALGEQVLVYTASAADESRAKFLACRASAGLGGTAVSTSTSGAYNPLATIAAATYPVFQVDPTQLLPGTHDIYGSILATASGTHTVSVRADADAGLDAVRVGAWQNVDITTGSAWPQIPVNVWRIVPLGSVTVGEDGGVLSLSVASSTGAQVRIDDLFLFHRKAGQLSMLDTKTASASMSAVRLDAASVLNPRPSAWVGTANGPMMDAALSGRCLSFDQHQADPGLLQIVTITLDCTTSRVSATYSERFGYDAATQGSS
jgi:hypothetical protein